MGITEGFASYRYSYKSFSFTAKINGIRKHFLAGCGIKQLKGLVEGFTILWRIRFWFLPEAKYPIWCTPNPKGCLWWESYFTAFFPTAENAPAVTTVSICCAKTHPCPAKPALPRYGWMCHPSMSPGNCPKAECHLQGRAQRLERGQGEVGEIPQRNFSIDNSFHTLLIKSCITCREDFWTPIPGTWDSSSIYKSAPKRLTKRKNEKNHPDPVK